MGRRLDRVVLHLVAVPARQRARRSGGGGPGRQQVRPAFRAARRHGHRSARDLGVRQLLRGRGEPVVRPAYAASQSEAMPWPTPMHMLAAPRATPRLRISCSKVVTILAPEQPSGCPMAIAPPLTLT